MAIPARAPGTSSRLWRTAPAGCVLVAVLAGGLTAARGTGADAGAPATANPETSPTANPETSPTANPPTANPPTADAATANPTAADAGGPPPDEPVAAVYRRDCAVCHGADGEGSEQGPPLTGSGPALIDYVIRTGRMPIDDPDDPVRRSEPPYDAATIDALVSYTERLQDGAVADGPPVPDVDPDAGDVGTGGSVWRQECAACHAWSGNGGAMLDRAAPDVREATSREMAEAVRAGPFAMPRFGDAAINQRQMDSLAAFFEEELTRQQDPGGWSLGHIGPVAEGGIALVLGLGSLAVVTRLIGSGREHR